MISPQPYTPRVRLVAAGFIGAVFFVAAIVGVFIGLRASPNHAARAAVYLDGAEYLGADKVIQQLGERDCGPASLSMVLRDLGRAVDPVSMSAEWGFTNREISFAEMIRVANSFGLESSPWLLSWRDFVSAPKPIIARVNGDHFVVVDVATDTHVLIRDPAIGVLRYSKSAFNRIWNGEALMFMPSVRIARNP